MKLCSHCWPFDGLQGGFRSLQRHGGSRDLWGDCQEGRERGGGQDDDGGDHDDHDGDGDDHDADGEDHNGDGDDHDGDGDVHDGDGDDHNWDGDDHDVDDDDHGGDGDDDDGDGDGLNQVVIGKQYQNHNSRPGPVYAGGGYTPINTVGFMLCLCY